MKVFIGADHTGFKLKEKLKVYLNSLKCEVEDMGAFELENYDDYPDFIKPVAHAVANDSESMGIVFGGSGQGEAMCANKIPGARCALFYGGVVAKQAIDVHGKESTDPRVIIKLAREHNNANILSLGVRFITEEEAREAVKIFLETPFSAEQRHVRRIEKSNI